jgi:glutathione synthase/RimK-type ligase-like ATP-grasp enzyme
VSRSDCTLVTCEQFPALDPDDRLLADELRRRGVGVSIGTWSDPEVDWAASRLCVLRSTWDYHRRYEDFIAWIERASAITTIRNDAHLLKWNAHKSYIRDIGRAGVPVVPTAWVAHGTSHRLSDLCESRGWRSAVVKPALGAAAHDVLLVRHDRASLAHGQAHLDRLLLTQDVLVQPYMEAVETYGERALMFFQGLYSHAVVKKPFDTVLVVSDEESARVEVTAEEINVAAQAMEAIPGRALYARVDLLHDDDGNARVSEVELIEPGLYLSVHAAARTMFADAIERELDAIPETQNAVILSRASVSS